jgi:diguanylate cyclase (GGDEF)-like protein
MPVVLGVFAVLLLAALWALYRARHARALAETRIAELELRLEDRDRALQDAAARLDELHGLLKDMSLRDGLTGLYNRRCLDQVLVEAWKTTVAQRDPLSLLMIDIDHFKQLNDKYGHGAGDDCLREVAQRLQRHATTLGGVVARYGGEEFVVVLAHTGTDIAQALAEALRNAVAGTPVKTSAAPLWVTISLGVATARPDGRDSLGAVLKRADEALYRAKREGRNRVAAG